MVSEVFYQNANSNYPGIVRDYGQVKSCVCQQPQDNSDAPVFIRGGLNNEAKVHSDAPVFCALKTIAPVRRVISAEEEAKQGNIIPAFGCASLMLINAREDLRDIEQAIEQGKAWWKGEKYASKYLVPDGANYKEYQHAFSAIRGTDGLENLVKKGLAKGSKWAEFLRDMDIVLSKTETGGNILNSLGVDVDLENNGMIKTKIEEIGPLKCKPSYVDAFKFKGSGKCQLFGELTARAMTRTTKLGILILAALEASKIIKSITQGETLGEQTKSTIRQTTNSAIKVTSVTAGIAYGGALGWKLGGPFGSLAGMGTGAILGALTSKKAQAII